MRLSDSDLQALRLRVKLSEKYVDERYVTERRPKIMWNWALGKHYAEGMPLAGMGEAMDRVVVNYSLVNVLVKKAAIAFGSPHIRVEPTSKGPEQRALAGLNEEALNAVWAAIKAQLTCRKAFWDCKVTGTGVVGTNWRFEGPKFVVPEAAKQPGDDFLMSLPQPPMQGPIIHDSPQVRRLRPERFLPDPDFPDEIQDGRYVAEMWRRPLVAVKRTVRYSNTADLKGDVTLADDYREALGPIADEAEEHLRLVTGYTVYARDLGARIVVAKEQMDKPLLVTEFDTIDPEGRPFFPYAVLANIEQPDCLYGLSDVEITETQQQELDAARSQLATHRRRSNPMYLVVRGILEAADKAAIRKGDAGSIVEVKLDLQRKLREVFATMPTQQIQSEVFAAIDQALRDFSELSRVAGYERAGAVPGVEYATEAALVSQGAAALKADERADWEAFLGTTAKHVAWWMYLNGTRPMQTPLPDRGPEEWVEWRGSQLRGAFEFSVEVGSTEPPNSAAVEAMWQGRLMALAPYADMGLDLRPVIRKYLDSMDLADVDEIMAGLRENVMRELQEEAAMGAGFEEGLPPEGFPAQGLPPEAAAMAGMGMGI